MGSQDLTEAVNMFIMTKFNKCFRECNKVIRMAKCEPEQERNYKIIEAATALGIQALAETDEWYSVVAFITNVYDAVDMCPPSIIQLCILLHAQVKEYLPCHQLVEIWLKNPPNLKQKLCSQVVRTYVQYILIPTGSYDLLKEVVWNCDCLTQKERSSLLQLSQSAQYKDSRMISAVSMDPTSPDSITEKVFESVSERFQPECDQDAQSKVLLKYQDQALDNTDINSNNTINQRSETSGNKKVTDLPTIFAVLHWLYEIVLSKMRCLRHPGLQIFLMGIIAVLALLQAPLGDPVSSLARLVILWRVFLQKLRMFFSST